MPGGTELDHVLFRHATCPPTGSVKRACSLHSPVPHALCSDIACSNPPATLRCCVGVHAVRLEAELEGWSSHRVADRDEKRLVHLLKREMEHFHRVAQPLQVHGVPGLSCGACCMLHVACCSKTAAWSEQPTEMLHAACCCLPCVRRCRCRCAVPFSTRLPPLRFAVGAATA